MWVTILFTALILGWAIWSYNRLVRDRERVKTGWSDIGVQLKRRHDLIPKLVAAVKQYAAYESATLEAVSARRSTSTANTDVENVGQVNENEGLVAKELKQLIAVAEQYPDLKTNASFLDLQKNLSNVEHHLQFARRYYNGAVRNLNTRIDSFPDTLLARSFDFRKANFFEFEAAAENQQ
jgi:LemA protein